MEPEGIDFAVTEARERHPNYMNWQTPGHHVWNYLFNNYYPCVLLMIGLRMYGCDITDAYAHIQVLETFKLTWPLTMHTTLNGQRLG